MSEIAKDHQNWSRVTSEKNFRNPTFEDPARYAKRRPELCPKTIDLSSSFTRLNWNSPPE